MEGELFIQQTTKRFLIRRELLELFNADWKVTDRKEQEIVEPRDRELAEAIFFIICYGFLNNMTLLLRDMSQLVLDKLRNSDILADVSIQGSLACLCEIYNILNEMLDIYSKNTKFLKEFPGSVNLLKKVNKL